MLDKFRNLNNNWFVKILMALVAISFAVFGINYYFQGGGGGAVVSVNGHKISQDDFKEGLELQIDRMRQGMQGSNLDPALREQPQIRYEVLQGLVNRQLMVDYANKNHLYIPDSLLVKEISQVQAFQENGHFSQAKYESLMNQRGLTVSGFEEKLRDDLKVQLEQETLMTTQWVSDTSVSAYIILNQQKREAQWVLYPLSQWASNTPVSPQDIDNYYKAHQKDYQLPERIKIQYVELSQRSIMEQLLPPTAREIQAYYDDPSHAKLWLVPEQRVARHILFKIPQGASESEIKAIEVKAQKVLDQLKEHPDQFAAEAKQYSDDPGSASRGGDLGSFEKGLMTPKFEEAVFSAKLNQLLGPVQTPFGWHIIQVTDIIPEHLKPIVSMAPIIEQNILSDKAHKIYADEAEGFSNKVFEQGGSLDGVANNYHLALNQSGWISKGVPSGNSELDNSKLQAQIFSSSTIDKGRNTEAVEVAPEVLVAAHVVAHEPASVQPLSEVSPKISELLLNQRMHKEASEQITHWIDDLKQKKEITGKWSAPVTLSQSGENGSNDPVSLAVKNILFTQKTDQWPHYFQVEIPELKSIAIVRWIATQRGDPTQGSLRAQIVPALAQAYSDEVMLGFINHLHQGAKIELLDPNVLKGAQADTQPTP